MENEIKLLKMVLRAGLTKIEIKVLIFLLEQGKKTITLTNPEMACACGLTNSNMTRAIDKLVKTQVVGKRKNGLFVKSINTWKAPKKVEE